MIPPFYRALCSERKETLMNQDHQRPQHPFHTIKGHSSPPRTPQEQRRALLWHERMKLEFKVQGLFLRAATLTQAWQRLHQQKAPLEHEVPEIATRIVLAYLVGTQQLPTAWQHSYEGNHLAQAESRIQQEMLRCSADIAFLQAQINVLDFELALL